MTGVWYLILYTVLYGNVTVQIPWPSERACMDGGVVAVMVADATKVKLNTPTFDCIQEGLPITPGVGG